MRNVLISWIPVSFSRRILLDRIIVWKNNISVDKTISPPPFFKIYFLQWPGNVHGLSGKFPNVQNSPPLRRPSGARQVLVSSNEFDELRRENRVALSCLVIVLCFFMWSHVWRAWRFSRDKKMRVFHEQRICVKFCVKIGKSVTETF